LGRLGVGASGMVWMVEAEKEGPHLTFLDYSLLSLRKGDVQEPRGEKKSQNNV